MRFFESLCIGHVIYQSKGIVTNILKMLIIFAITLAGSDNGGFLKRRLFESLCIGHVIYQSKGIVTNILKMPVIFAYILAGF